MNKNFIDGLMLGITVVAFTSIVTNGVWYSQLQEAKEKLDTQREMLYAPTTKQQCLDGTQLGFDAYVKQHNEQNYSVNNILLLAKARNADARAIAVAYSVHTEIDVAKGMLDTVVSHVPMMPKADAMELARKKREGWIEYCGTIA